MSNQDGAYEVSVYVNGLQAVCINNNCNYNYATSITPKISSVSPNSLSDTNTLLTINGQNFNTDASKVKVNVGAENCQVLTSSKTKITCTLNRLALGDQQVVIIVDGMLLLIF